MPLGFSSSKLDYVQNFMAGYVDDSKLPGYACLVSRRGEEALFLSCGEMDVERSKPMRRDTIFRIYSMTKPHQRCADDAVRKRALSAR